MSDFKQYYLEIIDGITEPFIKVGDKFFLDQNIQTIGYVKGQLGIQITPQGDFIMSKGIFNSGKTKFDNTETGFILGIDKGSSDTPKFYIGNTTDYLNWTGTALNISGTITATTGVIGGFTIGATTLSATNLTLTSGAVNTANIIVGSGADSAGLNSANAGTDIAIWAGSTFANRATAPFRVTAAGAVTGTSMTITGSTYNGLSLVTTVGTGLMNSSSGTQTIAHGLGITPTIVRFNYFRGSPTTDDVETSGRGILANGTTYYSGVSGSGTGSNSFVGTGNIIYVNALTDVIASATIAVDSTNITLTITNASGVGGVRFIWEATA